MAKNVLQKKQRIAHNKAFNEDHEMYPLDGDILSSIMEGMNGSMLSLAHSNNFETDFLEPLPFRNHSQKTHSSTHQIPHQNHTSVPKSKKFGVSRKFPLMEKTQRTLKQISHNRKMPKPRAHLAGSPVTKSPSVEIHSVSNAKVKKTKLAVNSVKSTDSLKKKMNEEPKDNISSKQSKPFILKKKSVEQSSLKSASKKQESSLTKNSSDKSQLKNCDSEDSDDYEKFILKEKKDLPKKSKSRKSNKKPNSATKKVANKRTVSKPLSSESDSDSSDYESTLSKSYPKNSKRRRKNVVEKRPSLIEESESEMDINDELCHDSSDSDNLTLSKLKNLRSSDLHKSPSVGEMSNDNPKQQYDLSSHRNLNVAQDELNVFQKTSGTSSLVASQPEMPSKIGSEPTSSVGAVSNGESFDLLNGVVKQENGIAKEISNKSIIVDLTGSDDECDNSSVMPKTSTQDENKSPTDYGTGDDSEVEMVDVILYDLPKPPKSRKFEPNSSNSTGESYIKKEVNPMIPSRNAKNQITQKPRDELPTSFARIPLKNEPVFSTDICKVVNEKESGWKSDQSIAEENYSLLLNKVKTEPADDCEIIFDAVSNSNASNKTVKIEKDFKVVKQTTTGNNPVISTEEKDAGSSNSGNVMDTFNKKSAPLKEEPKVDEVAMKLLFQELMHDFKTYKEIVQTEKSVEATFKMLETRQAKKVNSSIMSLKSKMHKILSVSPSNSEHCKVVKEMSKIIDSSELSSLKAPLSVCSDANIPSCDISIKDLKTFASMNIVPRSTISEEDIKPNLLELQSSIKKEPGTSKEINNMSFGEKCIVCAKDAAAACQQCAKVFFCSDACGKKYWNEGHKDACVK